MNNFEIKSYLEKYLHESKINVWPDKLVQYLLLLDKWNNTYNLTGVRNIYQMVHKHIIDSLYVIPWIKKEYIIDVGTGAGLPGIPLALTMPDCKIILLDSNGKKIRFLEEVKRVLSIDNIEINQLRVENYHPKSKFDTIITRAFSDLKRMISLTSHLLTDNGIWLAMKGQYPRNELQSIGFHWQTHSYNVPEIDGERTLIVINNK